MIGDTRIVRLVSGRYAVQKYSWGGYYTVESFDTEGAARAFRMKNYGSEVAEIIQ